MLRGVGEGQGQTHPHWPGDPRLAPHATVFTSTLNLGAPQLLIDWLVGGLVVGWLLGDLFMRCLPSLSTRKGKEPQACLLWLATHSGETRISTTGGVKDISKLGGSLDEWIPPDYDVYCIGKPHSGIAHARTQAQTRALFLSLSAPSHILEAHTHAHTHTRTHTHTNIRTRIHYRRARVRNPGGSAGGASRAPGRPRRVHDVHERDRRRHGSLRHHRPHHIRTQQARFDDLHSALLK